MTIKDVRKAQKLSQGELAAALGISVSSERSYEYGVRKPNAKVIEQIKELYGVDLNDEAAAPASAVEEKAAEAVAVEEKVEEAEAAPAKPKRGRKKKEAPVEAAPAVEEKVEKIEEAPAKPKRGRKRRRPLRKRKRQRLRSPRNVAERRPLRSLPSMSLFSRCRMTLKRLCMRCLRRRPLSSSSPLWAGRLM